MEYMSGLGCFLGKWSEQAIARRADMTFEIIIFVQGRDLSATLSLISCHVGLDRHWSSALPCGFGYKNRHPHL